MKSVNIISLIQAFENLEKETFKAFCSFFKINIKNQDILDLRILINTLKESEVNFKIFEKYYLGYIIPQIGKEFDLLRFGKNYNINIELKSTDTGSKIINQLKRNKYYLSFNEIPTLFFVFISDKNKIYKLDIDNNLQVVEVNDFIQALEEQEYFELSNIDNFFIPKNYLVSPFNSTEKFINNEYFLTLHQEKIKKDIIKLFSENKGAFVSICGKPGTGKTLLTYDIISELKNDLEVIILHCGKINEGHNILKEDYNWKIFPIKKGIIQSFSEFSLIVIDEVQRIYPNQLEYIIKEVKKSKLNCIFSFDSEQCLRTWEINNNIPELIQTLAKPEIFNLTDKIRTNKEVSYFIKSLFDSKKKYPMTHTKNIEISYFSNSSDAVEFIDYLRLNNWKVINYTPSSRYKLPYEKFSIFDEDNAHDVIGQEFDKVIAVIDSHFYYNEEGLLSTRNYDYSPYYHPTKMLFQIVTRTREKLNVIVIKNEVLMRRCLELLN